MAELFTVDPKTKETTKAPAREFEDEVKEAPVAYFVQALDELLDQIIKCDRATARRMEGRPISFTVHSGADFDIKKIPTRRQSRINRVLQTPVRGACKNAIHLLGERLYEIGGTDFMEKVNDRVLRRKKKHFGYRANIIDKTWDGIGMSKDDCGWVA